MRACIHDSRGHRDTDLAALLHKDPHVTAAGLHLHGMITGLIKESGAATIRDDVAPTELATFCLHALTAAASLPSKAAVRRLVTITLTGLLRDSP